MKQLKYIKEPYARLAGGKVIIDPNMANFDIINYKTVNNIYRSKTNVINELMASDRLNVTDDTAYTAPQDIKLLSKLNAPFKVLFDIYCQVRENQPMLSTPDYRLEQIENRNPLVREAYDKLGRNRVAELKYHVSNIQRELTKLSNKGNDYKIVTLVEGGIPLHRAVTVACAKDKLQEIYNDLGLERKAKATDLMNWFEVQQTTKRINGKSTACIILVRSKFIRLSGE